MTIPSIQFIQAFAELAPTKLFLSTRVNTPSSPVLTGLAGSSLSLLASAYAMKVADKITDNDKVANTGVNVFIFEDRDEAGYFFNDLQQLFKSITEVNREQQIQFFPSSYKRSIRYEQTDPNHLIQRTAVLASLNESSSKKHSSEAGASNGGLAATPFNFIITTAEAICEKVIRTQALSSKTLHLKKGEKVDLQFIKELLFEFGFEKTDFVYEPGQFSIRGSIVDIFSFSDNKPYRMDLFDDEVDSLRSFNLSTQLSEEHLNEIEIIPNLHNHDAAEELGSFFDHLPQNTQLWIKDLQVLIPKINEQNVADLGKNRTLNTYEFVEQIKPLPKIHIGSDGSFKEAAVVIDFGFSPQTAYNKKFELFAKHLDDLDRNGVRRFICSENPKQADRLRKILDNYPKENTVFDFGQFALHEGFMSLEHRMAIYTDHQLFGRFHRYVLNRELERSSQLTLEELTSLHPGDYIVHIDHGIGIFGGLVKQTNNGVTQEFIKLTYRDNDVIFVNIQNLHRIAKYKGQEGTPPKIYKLGTGAWQKLKQTTKAKVKDIAKDLIALYAKRLEVDGFAFSADTYLQNELEASFIYEDTPDQQKATQAVKEDMEKNIPMDRLVCGDVGFGKTEVAIRAAFKAACDGKQTAVLVPTTILALQHHKTFQDRLENFPVRIEHLSRMVSAKKTKEILHDLKEGKIDILIGTHKLIGKGVEFKDLGLLVIDEEQKFGVSAKEKLKQLRLNVDTLTLTATPIPRTLQFSLMGARDLSVIQTPPSNRQPINTEVHSFNTEIIREAIEFEIQRGGQVFFIHNRVNELPEMEAMINTLCPSAKTGVAHGQMTGDSMEDVLMAFIMGEFDVLIATSIIENGLDIPNANTIIINRADRIGLSDLHQMRGRVGRSNRKAFCYLLTPPPQNMTNDARRRLKAIEEFAALGSGFSIAMQDLDIRGAGNMLGAEQSGFITDIGFETYQRILNEALLELRDEQGYVPAADEAQVQDCSIETDMELLLPDTYIPSSSEKMRLYREIDSLPDAAAIDHFRSRLLDRFGPIPAQTEELLDAIRLRQIAMLIGFEKIVLKSGKMIAYFIANPKSSYFSSPHFAQILQYITQNPKQFLLKEKNDKLGLTIFDAKSIGQAMRILQTMYDACKNIS